MAQFRALTRKIISTFIKDPDAIRDFERLRDDVGGLLDTNNEFTGNNTFSGDNTFSGNNLISGANDISGNNDISGDNTLSGDNAFTGNNTHAGTETFDNITVSPNSTGNVSRRVSTTALATGGQYAKLRTYSFPATNDVSAVSTLLLTPIGNSSNYKPIEIEVIAKQGTSGLDTTNAQINVIRNSEEAVLYNDFDLVTAAATNGTDIMLWMRSAVAAKYAVQVIAEEFDTGVSVVDHDGATWTATNPVTGAAASVTSDWRGEESYVPSITIGGSSTGITYSVQQGVMYKKDGVLIDEGYIALTSAGGLTGALYLLLGRNARHTLTFVHADISMGNTVAGVTTIPIMLRIDSGTNAQPILKANGTGYVAVTSADITNGVNIRWQAIYGY